jgi:dihydrofolate reductase
MAAEIVAVVAMDEKNGIGKNGQIPWDLPQDRRRFMRETKGHPVIMGRKTYFESIPIEHRPLKGRSNIVMSRSPELMIQGCRVAHSIEEALELARGFDDQRIAIIGGVEVYMEAFAVTDLLYLTRVQGDFNCDAVLPQEYIDQFPVCRFREEGEFNGQKYTFEDLTRKVE